MSKSVLTSVRRLAQSAKDSNEVECNFFSAEELDEVKRAVQEVSSQTGQPGFVPKTDHEVTVFFYPNQSYWRRVAVRRSCFF